ncbi:MAG: hypothetical protein BWY81_00123 [Firmicutes bacterium ADurb.Bin467]|nr:MAG: hypothetical protein BWY81_00123 [Firmicutes bacterium ADurb.Bin467]
MFMMTISAITRLAARLSSRTRSTHMPNTQFMKIEPSITSTNTGSPQP